MTSETTGMDAKITGETDQITPRPRSAIGDLLRTLRGEHTLREVERDTGIPNSYLSNLELGMKNPGLKTLTKLSEFYQVPLNELLRVANLPHEESSDPDAISVLDIMRSYRYVVMDPDLYQFQAPQDSLPLDVQLFIVRLYEHYTGKKLL